MLIFAMNVMAGANASDLLRVRIERSHTALEFVFNKNSSGFEMRKIGQKDSPDSVANISKEAMAKITKHPYILSLSEKKIQNSGCEIKGRPSFIRGTLVKQNYNLCSPMEDKIFRDFLEYLLIVFDTAIISI